MPRQACRSLLPILSLILGVCLVGHIIATEYESGKVWPEPKLVVPGENGGPPDDAVVLFDGKDLSHWTGGHWIVKDGVATVHGGDMRTKDSFGDYQLHVEWAEPEKVSGSGQGRGNSGIFLADRYELQVLDSYHNPTYFDGQCGAIYKQKPPLVNASRKPGEWQTLRYRVRSAAIRRRRQTGTTGVCHRPAKRHRGAESSGDHRLDVVRSPADLHGTRPEAADPLAGPRQPGPLSQHLAPRDVNGVEPQWSGGARSS